MMRLRRNVVGSGIVGPGAQPRLSPGTIATASVIFVACERTPRAGPAFYGG